jgi:hypothetical protein
LKALPYFNSSRRFQTKASGAGATGMQTQMASNNELQLVDFGNI